MAKAKFDGAAALLDALRTVYPTAPWQIGGAEGVYAELPNGNTVGVGPDPDTGECVVYAAKPPYTDYVEHKPLGYKGYPATRAVAIAAAATVAVVALRYLGKR